MVTQSKIIIFFLFTCFFFTWQSAQGATTKWQNCTGGKVRIILLPSKEPATYKGAIELDIKDGWKSFWRNPGASGFAPQLTTEKNYKTSIFYPTPIAYQDNNIYKGHVFLPIIINKTSDNIKGNLLIGFCKDLCIPLKLDFTFTNQDLQQPNLYEQLLISQAFAKLPILSTKEPKSTKIKNKHLILTFTALNKQLPNLFIDGGNLEFTQPKLIAFKNCLAQFSTNIPTNLPKNASLYYNFSNGPTSIEGNFKLPK